MEEVNKMTFTPEAMQFVTNTLSLVKDLEAKLEAARETTKTLRGEVTDKSLRIEALKGEIEALQNKLDGALAREAKVAEAEKQVAVANAKSDTIKDCFDTIFRNTVVRRKMQNDVYNPGQYDSNGVWMSGGNTVRENHTTEETEE